MVDDPSFSCVWSARHFTFIISPNCMAATHTSYSWAVFLWGKRGSESKHVLQTLAGRVWWGWDPASSSSLYELSPLPSRLNGFSASVGWAFPGNQRPHQNLLPPWPFGVIPKWSQDALTVPFSRRWFWVTRSEAVCLHHSCVYHSQSQRIMEMWGWVVEWGPGTPGRPHFYFSRASNSFWSIYTIVVQLLSHLQFFFL